MPLKLMPYLHLLHRILLPLSPPALNVHSYTRPSGKKANKQRKINKLFTGLDRYVRENNCVLDLEYGRTQDLRHSFLPYGPPATANTC